MGLYVSYVNPGKYYYKVSEERTAIIDGWQKTLFVDVPFHILTFAFIWSKYASYYKNEAGDTDFQLLLSVYLLLFYFCVCNVEEVYRVPFTEFAVVFSIVNVMYFFFF